MVANTTPERPRAPSTPRSPPIQPTTVRSVDWYIKLIRKIFPSKQISDAARSLVVMGVLLGAVLTITWLTMTTSALQALAAWLTAAGVLFIAYADARAIGTVHLKNETAEPTVTPPTGNPAGTWPRLIGQGCLVPGALFLILTL